MSLLEALTGGLKVNRFLQRRSFLQSVVSIISMLMFLFVLSKLASWGAINASFGNITSQQCAASSGACWAAATQRINVIFFGTYPTIELWRAQASLLILVAAIIGTCVPFFWQARRMLSLWLALGLAFLVLMRGGIFGLTLVPTALWGGFTLNLFIFFCVVMIGMPIAIALALMRQSRLRGIRFIAGAFIDLTRSLPLVGILFFAVLIFPLVLPRGVETDTLFRVVFAFAFFFACYEAEVLRGGFQTIDNGQLEASDALGLTYWNRTRLVVLPQVLEKSFPTTLNQFVITFKETSLVFIVGLFDVLRAAEVSISTPGWSAYYTEVYMLVASLFFVVTFSLSRYGRFLEERMASSRARS